MNRSDSSIETMVGASSRDAVWTRRRRRRSLVNMDGYDEMGSAAVIVNQCSSDCSLTYALINDG